MSTTFRKNGHRRTHTAASALSSGDVVGPMGTGEQFGIAVTDLANGATGALEISGEHDLAAESADVWADGDILYWDVADSNLTDQADGGTNKRIGIAVGAKAASATTARVLLNTLPR